MRPFGFLRRQRYWILLAHFSAANVHAQPPDDTGPRLANTELEVQRGAGAQDCPDTDQLTAELRAQGVSRSGPPVLQQIHVGFSRNASEYTAELTMSGWRTGRRVFSTADPTCAGVRRATVLAISILLDPNVEMTEQEGSLSAPPPLPPGDADPSVPPPPEVVAPIVPAPVSPPPQPQTPPVFPPAMAIEPPPTAPTETGTLWAGAGLGAASDFSQWEAWTFELGLRWRPSRVALELAGFVTTPDVERGTDGETQVMFMGGHARSCLTWPPGLRNVLELNLCGQVSAAAVRGWAEGYDNLERAQYSPWLAIGPMAQLAGALGPPFDWRILVAFPIAITRQSYVVETSAGSSRTAFTTEPWSFWLSALADLPIL